MAEQCRRVRITGRVQHVAFRAWTRDQAQRLGLKGWVRNEHDGSVAALIAGPEQAVARMLELLEKGPPAARVASVRGEAVDAEANTAAGFSIIR